MMHNIRKESRKRPKSRFPKEKDRQLQDSTGEIPSRRWKIRDSWELGKDKIDKDKIKRVKEDNEPQS